MRRVFALPEQDTTYLQSSCWEWETIVDGGQQWILFHNYTIPNGYNTGIATIALSIPPGYPVAQLDMVYFYPNLSRSDGKIIGALSVQSIDGKPFQRWSRHRTAENPWRPGLDDISAHLTLVDYWLERELKK